MTTLPPVPGDHKRDERRPRTTSEELKVLGPVAQKAIPAAKLAALVLGILTPAVTGAMVAYQSSRAEGLERAQATKDKAEAGFQVTRQAVEDLQLRVLTLERAAKLAQEELARARRRSPRQPAPAIPPALQVAVTANPRPLPRDLDRAAAQVYQGAPPQPRADAAP